MGVRIPVAPELALFYKTLLSQEGFPYVWPVEANRWSGKGLPSSLFPNGRDCSGTVTWALHEAGYRPDLRAVANTRWMWANWKEALTPLPGDFALYRDAKTSVICHVMTLMEDGRVFGADGAGSNCTTPEVAARLNAKVQWRSGPHYGAGLKLAGFRTNPLRRTL
jgi:cell wall-associated NlpC family hydrolase